MAISAILVASGQIFDTLISSSIDLRSLKSECSKHDVSDSRTEGVRTVKGRDRSNTGSPTTLDFRDTSDWKSLFEVPRTENITPVLAVAVWNTRFEISRCDRCPTHSSSPWIHQKHIRKPLPIVCLRYWHKNVSDLWVEFFPTPPTNHCRKSTHQPFS